MDALGLLLIVLYFFSVARVTRLINADEITDPIRIFAATRALTSKTWAKLSYLLGCAWCVSIWVAFATSWTVVAALDLPWWWLIVLALTASHLTGLASQLDGTDVEIVVEDE